MLATRIGQALVFISLASACAITSAADCDANCLRTNLNAYLQALTTHDVSKAPVATNVLYTENGEVRKLGEGLWERASSIGRNAHRFVDPISQQAFFIGVIKENDAPAIVSLRLGIKDRKIAEIEHIVARKGSHALFSPEYFEKPNPILDARIERKNRLSREQLIAIANSYLEGVQQHSSKIIKAAPDCQRVENGVQTTHQPGRSSRNCQESADMLTYIKSVDERRFPIVDVKRGIVIATFTFNIPGERSNTNDAAISSDPQLAARLRQSRTLLLSEWFKIDHGVIQHIEAVMHNLPHGSHSGWTTNTQSVANTMNADSEAPQLQSIMTVVAKIDAPIAMGKTPQGDRRVIPISGGDVDGANIKGAILPGGEDWQLTRPDGVTELDARYWLRTDDGVVIRVRNRALAVPASSSNEKRHVRCAPEFDAPIGKYDWLNKGIFVGTLAVNNPPTAVTLRFFKVL